MSNTFGRMFRLTTFGESHGPAVGGVVDGCPAGLRLDMDEMRRELAVRRPGAGGAAVSARREEDKLIMLSGLAEGVTTGAPIAFMVENVDQRPDDYARLRDLFRPGHADFTYLAKYGTRESGGGRASGRETVARVAGGAIALQLLRHFGVSVRACVLELGGIKAETVDLPGAAGRPFFAADDASVEKWEALCRQLREEGDSTGGVALLEALGLPPGLGEPVFDKLDARIGAAMFGVGAVKGVEIGAGFAAAALRGSKHNDAMLPCVPGLGEACLSLPGGGGARFVSNHAGGVLGGLSTGQPLLVKVALKPVSSIGLPQKTVDSAGRAADLSIGGRHDVCVIPRAVPVLKAMLALTLADFMLLERASVL